MTTPYHKLKDVALRYQVSYRTLLSWIRSGKLRASRFGGQWRVSEQELTRFERQARALPPH